MVTRVDRLACSNKEQQDIKFVLNQHVVTLREAEQPVGRRSAAGKALLDMPGLFAEFETNLQRARQIEGISAAKARGVYRGRKPCIDPAQLWSLYTTEKMGATAIARQTGEKDAGLRKTLKLSTSNTRQAPLAQ